MYNMKLNTVRNLICNTSPSFPKFFLVCVKLNLAYSVVYFYSCFSNFSFAFCQYFFTKFSKFKGGNFLKIMLHLSSLHLKVMKLQPLTLDFLTMYTETCKQFSLSYVQVFLTWKWVKAFSRYTGGLRHPV